MNFNHTSQIPKDSSLFNSRGIVSLDLLRGLAAYLVIIPHFFIFGF